MTESQHPRETRNRLRRQAEAKMLATQAVLEAARPFARVTSLQELAAMETSNLSALRQAFAVLDALD